MSLPVLTSPQRDLLKAAVKSARTHAESGASKALQALAVDRHVPFPRMTPAAQTLRNRLRAHGRQLGDAYDSNKGTQETRLLVREVAFEQWHRMLFARFLAENQLLIDPTHGVAISMAEAEELAREAGTDAWTYAAKCAQSLLPAIFRTDDASLAVDLPPEARVALEKELSSLEPAIFTASDALGWTYQFWQSEEKERVNKKGDSVGAEDISAVTQLFTEHYMVEFLLHNTLGAWHAGKVFAAKPELLITAASEAELRAAVAIEGCAFEYLRFVRDGDESSDDGTVTGPWRIGAGTYPTWPKSAAEVTVLDPCLGSGHILVAAFELLVHLRRAEEGLGLDAAIQAVIRDNVFGLELDPRCTQIGAFALALHAWKLAGRRIDLPLVNIACCGLSVGGSKEQWMRFGGGNSRFQAGMATLHELFQQAPLLGSLIDPARAVSETVHVVGLDDLEPMLDAALASATDDTAREVGVAATGMVEAIQLLRRSYTLVMTNPPYLGRGNQVDEMKAYADTYAPEAKQDLATLFVARALRWCAGSGSIAMVTPQNWLFLTRYKKLRERLLKEHTWTAVARLGPGAFREISGEVVQAALIVISGTKPCDESRFLGIDVSNQRGERPILATEKAEHLAGMRGPRVHVGGQALRPRSCLSLVQSGQLAHPEARIVLGISACGDVLGAVACSYHGISTTDYARFGRIYVEVQFPSHEWVPQQSTVDETSAFDGRSNVLLWEGGAGGLRDLYRAKVPVVITGLAAWGHEGVAISQIGDQPVTRYSGQSFDDNTAVVIPNRLEDLPAIWLYCASEEFSRDLRAIDQSLKVTYPTMVQVPFDDSRWRQLAQATFPLGLPRPQTNDLSQWLFHGHPVAMLCGATTWEACPRATDRAGRDRHASLICRVANPAAVLQVAVARIAGYRWPAELDESMELDIACRDWATRCTELADHADDDGVVPINAMRGEPSAADRVTALLRDAFAQANATCTTETISQLIAAAGSNAASLDDWLLDDFFAQHCKVFDSRPFVWHLWDGRRDGFNVLVHYHRLVAPNGEGRKLLEKLTHSYLGDWILRQRQEVAEKRDGAEGRLAAALGLQQELLKILEGEPPYGVFVRWKPLHQQAIGWEPDINDGVRLNIRPFLMARSMRQKGAGLLRSKPNIKWGKDRGHEPESIRPKQDFPWFWGCDPELEPAHRTDFMGGATYTGNRWNDLHYTNAAKLAAQARHAERGDA